MMMRLLLADEAVAVCEILQMDQLHSNNIQTGSYAASTQSAHCTDLQVYLPPEILLGTSPSEDAAAAGVAAQVPHWCHCIAHPTLQTIAATAAHYIPHCTPVPTVL